MREDPVLERLAEADPTQGLATPSPRSAKARALLASLRRVDPAAGRGTVARRLLGRLHAPRTLRWIVPVGALMLVAAASVVFVPASSPEGVTCYEHADTGSSRVVADNLAEGPLVACERLWEQGLVRDGVTEAPMLVGCVNEAGAVAVIPGTGEGLCADLGWEALDASDSATAESLVELHGRLSSAFAGRCRSPADAHALVSSELEDVAGADPDVDAASLAEWTIEVADGFDDERPCATPAIDSEQGIVRLVPTERLD